MKNKKKNIEVSEPIVPYISKEIRIFSSFEEADEENLKWLASLAPEQHLQHTVSLIKRVFAEKLLKHPKLGTVILID